MRLKVSNVCQLLDKSKFPATLTEGGVTFTNNGDGTITANGTSTKNYAHYPIVVPRPAIGHKILVLPKNNGKTQDHIYVWASSSDSNSGWVDDLGYGGNIITITGIGNTLKNPYTAIGINLNVNKDWVMNNHIYKPQFFDLTEMYGAGNEPTTIAQFRQDFPNEMYEYSPVCWKKFRRLKYVTETKNLFDISNADIISKDYYFTLNQGEGSNFYVMTVKPGATYTVSYERFINSDDTLAPSALELSIQTGTRYTDGTRLFLTLGGGERGVWVKRSGHFTVPSGITQVTFSGLRDRFLYRNFMVQEGSTATPYQPYGYLPLNRGKYIANKEPVQLLDKSRYPATGTSNGITYTKNEDGSYDVNGTVTKNGLSTYLIGTAELKKNHIYLNNSIPGTVANSQKSYVECKIYYRSEGKWVFPAARFKCSLDDAYAQITLLVNQTAGTVISDEKLCPELFDLTEMYGAGNEPTAEEFWATHSKTTMYDYNPYNAITFR